MKVPEEIYLQWHGCDKDELLPGEIEDGPDKAGDVTWCTDKIHDTDMRYVLDKRYRRKAKG